MKVNDLLDLAARNLRESKLRNGLTTAGIGVGVASLVAMLSLGVGLQELANNRLTRSGLFDTIVVYARSEMRGIDSGRRRDRDREPNAPGEVRLIDEAARAELEKLPHVAEVFPNVSFAAEVRYGDVSQFTVVSSVPFSAKTNDAFDSITGSFFTSPEAEEAILRLQFAKALTDKPESLVGKEITIRYGVREPLPAPEGSAKKTGSAAGSDSSEQLTLGGFTVTRREKKLKVVGITESQPFNGPQFMSLGRGGINVPIALAEKLNLTAGLSLRDFMRNSTSNRTYQSLMVRVKNPSKVKATEDAIDKMGLNTFSLLEATRNLRRFFAVLDAFLGLFGSVALAVASLGIINTLVMSVLERRREIGIMKALGASNGDVKKLFFAEAGAMGFAGGLLGVALGWAIGKAINFGTNIYLQRQELPPETIWSVPWWLVAWAIGFAVAVSLLSGLYPAARAAKLDPVQALRYE